MAVDVTETTFKREVVERSHEVPVVVDFWASWCGPCRVLGPVLEEAVAARDGQVVLAKVDVDRNQGLASAFRVQGIPAVKAFRDGKLVAEFVGAQPRQQVETFLDQLVPGEADRLAARGLTLAADGDPAAAEAAFRDALGAEPRHEVAATELARLLVERDPDQALQLVAPHRPKPAAEQVAARAELARNGAGDLEELRRRVDASPDDGAVRLELGRALAAAGDYPAALEELLTAVRLGGDTREPAREQLVQVFSLLGDGHPLVADARRRLAAALY